ncbi:MAG TPA: SAM-dependent methyltransferase [Spirochaetales bacterium]|nr:SAM-dependent methyltransferase [Spirochaetales bacterium]HRY53309.1 SAM-dependent methyltransferase [Spirochaetia bacterium]HRZ64686.1 SAM-dependent methyltransferase [Spirochaetia bacterium]
MEGKLGVLYLVPNLLDPESPPEAALPAQALARIRLLRRFVVEGEKAAWRLLGRILDPEAARAATLERLDEHTPPEALPALLDPLKAGEDLGLLSEAGLPCVADPGSALVALAHGLGARVVPLVGPSSLLLALAASGLDGQRFSFLGYLSQEPAARRSALSRIDAGVRADGATRIFIETPYRNARLLEDCLASLSPGTRLCVAVDLTGPAEALRSAPVSEWRARPWLPGKLPAVFLVGAVPGTSLDRGAFYGHSGDVCKNRKR